MLAVSWEMIVGIAVALNLVSLTIAAYLILRKK
jgi:hypothetical protein